MRITRKEFAAWLAKNQRKPFYKADPCWCALARYLTEKSGAQAHVLSPDAYGDDWELTLPRWATEFVDKFDALPGESVSGKRALALL